MLNKSFTSIFDQNGSTLIEVLVSIIVLVIGLIGLANLQTVALYNAHSAHLRSQATQSVYDLIDRIRSNQAWRDRNGDGWDDYDFNYGAYSLNIIQGLSAPKACTAGSNCTQVEMANRDIFEWNNTLVNSLPAGQGEVCLDSAWNDTQQSCDFNNCDGRGSTYVIRVQWNDDRGNTQCFLTTFVPLLTP